MSRSLIVVVVALLGLVPAQASAQAQGFVVDAGKARKRALRKRKALERQVDRAERAVRRLSDQDSRRGEVAAKARRRLLIACAQEALSASEKAAAQRLEDRLLAVRRIDARLDAVRAEIKSLEGHDCGGCCGGCEGCFDPECGCQARRSALEKLEMDGYEALDRAEERVKKTSEALIQAIDPTRVASYAAELRLAERKWDEAGKRTGAARKELARVQGLLKQAKAN